MKKIITCFVAAALLVSSLIPVTADQIASQSIMAVPATQELTQTGPDESKAKVSKEQAKQIAAKLLKDYFELQVEDKSYQVSIQYNQNTGYYPYGVDSKRINSTWNINYQLNSANFNTQAMVTVDANTGKITNFNRYEYSSYNQNQLPLAVYSKEQAKKIGEDFLNKLDPEEMKQVKYMDYDSLNNIYGGFKGSTYSFSYIRQVNGIPFDNDSIVVSVDGVTGKVSSYNYMWDSERSFPSIDSAIKKEKASEILKDNLKLTLNYIPEIISYSYSLPPKTAKLVYSMDYSTCSAIDANDGTVVNINQITGETPKVKDLSDKEKADYISKYKQRVKLDKELDSDKAQEIMKNKLKEIFGEEYSVDSLNYQDNGGYWAGGNSKCWNGQFYKKGSIPNYGPPEGNIAINSDTGEIISIYKNDFMQNQDTGKFEPKITWEDAYYKALNIIAVNFPDKIKEIKTEQQYLKQINSINGVEVPERYYSFNFVRLVNGIPCQQNSINMSIDIKTGLLNMLNENWFDGMTFSDSSKAIGLENANKIYFDAHEPEMAYMSVSDGVYNNTPESKIKLVYRLKSSSPYMPYNMDATNGKWISMTGQDMDEADKQNKFQDLIKGNWAEKELGILAFQGIIDTASFKPNNSITKLDAIKMLVNAKGYMYYMGNSGIDLKFRNIAKDTEEYKYLQMAVNYGILENKDEDFKLDGNVTREEMAEMIVKLVKYDKLAGARDIFSLSFSDSNEISPEKYGYVAIGKGLGMFIGDSGKFRPKDNATMAEMAVAIYKGIGSIQEVAKN